ncbi:MAG: BrnA antitoxin family protein [Gemmatimonadales bacterium]
MTAHPKAKPKPASPRKAVAGKTKRPASEEAEREYWATADVTEHFDWSRVVTPRLPELRPSTAAISLRLPVGMLDDLKRLAGARDVPYQSLMKVYLADRIAEERRRPGKA